jgi:hypothetical protein
MYLQQQQVQQEGQQHGKQATDGQQQKTQHAHCSHKQWSCMQKSSGLEVPGFVRCCCTDHLHQ